MILVNGIADADVPATDRGLAYGDGVFRTLRVLDGTPRHWQRHYAKLARDCAALELPCIDEPLLRHEVMVARDGADCTIKVIVTRGAGERGYAPAVAPEALRVVIGSAWPGYPSAHAKEGVRVRACRLRLGYQPALAGVKHLNRLENVLARAEWSDPAIAEGLLRDVEDNVICGTMTNLFIVRAGVLATPRLDRCGVAGVTRERVIEAAARSGLSCEIRDVAWAEALGADEMFLVNSLAGVWPVRALDDTTWPVGPATRALQRVLAQEDSE